MPQSREQHRAYMRERRANSRKVTPIKTSSEPASMAAGAVLEAVEEELAGLPLAARRPADAATARAMARILDDPSSVPQQAPAAARLREIMTDLRAGADGGKGKLAQLRSVRASG